MSGSMSALFEVQKEVNLVAEAIKSVLNLEVIIYDANKVVVAATGGGNHAPVGKAVRGHIIKEVLTTREPVYNFNPGFHKVCQGCELAGKCPEKVDVSFPLYHSGEVIGVISLTAFSDEQTDEFRHNYSVLANYLDKMADLISSKINSRSLLKQYETKSQMLDFTIESMYEGILALDPNGFIVEVNRAAETILRLNKSSMKGLNVQDILPALTIQEVLTSGVEYKDQQLVAVFEERTINLIGNVTPLVYDGQVIRIVVSFKDLNEVRNAVDSITSEDEESSFGMINGNSKAIVSAKNMAKKVATSDSNVLILGESGTGKELFARAIHQDSPRAKKPFRAINCAAIPEHLLESELFGYSEGAFTGASKKGKAGKFEITKGGTVFLDEIGDMPLHLQVKILRVLEERTVERVGANESIEIDVRIIAATNKDLEKMVEVGEFREDLFYRLNVIPLHIPPLRSRTDDIPMLLQHFASYYSKVLKKQIRGFTKAAERRLSEYQWPGNIRELQNAVEYAVSMAGGYWIEEHHLSPRIRETERQDAQEQEVFPLIQLGEMERKLILQALERYGNSVEGKKKAAQALGINLATLYRKINKMNAPVRKTQN